MRVFFFDMLDRQGSFCSTLKCRPRIQKSLQKYLGKGRLVARSLALSLSLSLSLSISVEKHRSDEFGGQRDAQSWASSQIAMASNLLAMASKWCCLLSSHVSPFKYSRYVPRFEPVHTDVWTTSPEFSISPLNLRWIGSVERGKAGAGSALGTVSSDDQPLGGSA